ncbi:CcdC family protein [Jeotgalicoccus psychrophilus]|uniref:CcdC family protein n=1 Tax=Jeotgalicoccus psychrophilus TaxID=157228 RepID=UPI0003F67988|nr:cytochrome c biogenesis protein CcdC [Jeotgalicoccus psychrophilus]
MIEFLESIEELLFLIASIGAVIMGIVVIFVRKHASKTPLTLKKIIIPPVMMSTGALMYIFPYFRLSWIHIAETIVIGAIFSVVLIITTKYEVKNSELYVRQTKAFPVILMGLLLARIALKYIFSLNTTPGEIGGMFFLLAFVMIGIWRLSMFIKHHDFKKQQAVA